MISANVITNIQDFLILKDKWNKAVESSEFDSIFLTHEWFYNFIKAFHSFDNLIIAIVYDQDDMVGIFPLIKKKMKFNFTFLCSISNVHTPIFSFVIKSGYEYICEKALLLLKKQYHWDVIVLEHVCEMHMCNLLKGLNDCKTITHRIYKMSKRVGIKIETDWDKYYKTQFSKKLRKNIEYSIRKANSEFVVEEENICGPQLIDTYLQEAFEIENSGWKGENNSSILKDEKSKAFYTDLAISMNERGNYLLKFLNFNNERIAFDYYLIDKKKYYLLKIGFKDAYKKYSPGHILRVKALKEVFEGNNVFYDFLGDNDLYKIKMANTEYQLFGLYLFNNTMGSRILKFLNFDFPTYLDRLGLKKVIKKWLH
jgi:CelD/BcsL family acetyltransferase involved in cellulose biosynthesis